jgi:hypothetical protein
MSEMDSGACHSFDRPVRPASGHLWQPLRQLGGDGLGLARQDKMNRVYAVSRIAIGDSLCPGFGYPYYLSDRTFNMNLSYLRH